MYSITLQTSDSNISQSDILGRLSFAASSETDGSSSILVGASIIASAESSFDSNNNPTSIDFYTSETGSLQKQLSITSQGHFLLNETILISDGESVSGCTDTINITRNSSFINDSYSTIIGFNACDGSYSNEKSLILGYTAGLHSNNIDRCVMLGNYTGGESSNCSESIYIGSTAGNYSSGDNYCSAIGYYSARYSKNDQYTSYFGPYAGGNTGTGTTNRRFGSSYLGYYAGYNSSGSNNIYIGINAGRVAIGDNNIEIISSGQLSPNGFIGTNSNKLSIGGVIFGDMSTKKIAVGNVTKNDTDPDATWEVKVSSGTDVGIVVQGASSQSANLQEWQNSSETVKAYVTKDGYIGFSDTSELQSAYSPVQTSTSTNITLDSTYAGKYSRLNNASAITVTVPSGLSVPTYAEFSFEQMGAGQISLSAASGVTINTPSSLSSYTQYSVIGLKKVGTNTYTAFGDLT